MSTSLPVLAQTGLPRVALNLLLQNQANNEAETFSNTAKSDEPLIPTLGAEEGKTFIFRLAWAIQPASASEQDNWLDFFLFFSGKGFI